MSTTPGETRHDADAIDEAHHAVLRLLAGERSMRTSAVAAACPRIADVPAVLRDLERRRFAVRLLASWRDEGDEYRISPRGLDRLKEGGPDAR